MNAPQTEKGIVVEGVACSDDTIPTIERYLSLLHEAVRADVGQANRIPVTLTFKGDIELSIKNQPADRESRPLPDRTEKVRDLILSTDPQRGARGDAQLVLGGGQRHGFELRLEELCSQGKGLALLHPLAVTAGNGELCFQLTYSNGTSNDALSISWRCPFGTSVSMTTAVKSTEASSNFVKGELQMPTEQHLLAEIRTPSTSKLPIPTYSFALAVVEKDGRFLLVQERKANGTWYLPAGRVEQGESIYNAVVRETLEEAGIKVAPVSLQNVEHTPGSGSRPDRMRFIFECKAICSEQPKTVADEHSLGAAWFTLDEIQSLELRSPEVVTIISAYLSSRGSK